MKIDLKYSLESHLPSLFKLTDETFNWNDLNKNFEKYVLKHKRIIISQDDIEGLFIVRNLYTTIAGKIDGNEQDIVLCSYIDLLLDDLSQKLDSNGKKQIQKTLFDLLLFEGFSDYFGELSVLNKFIGSGKYKLLETEVQNGNKGKGYNKRKGIDFKLIDLEEGREINVEVINIKIQDKHIKSNDEIGRFLLRKFEDKIQDKDRSGLEYFLIPVIWYEKVEILKKLKKFYDDTSFEIDNILVPFAYTQTANFNIRFSSIQYKFPDVSDL